jgi:tetratricopeptide (TPR) repeat protein
VKRPPLLVAAAIAASALAAAARPAAAVEQGAFSRAAYFELIRRYARGERAEAIAGLGAWSERDLARQLGAVEQAARDAERCPACPNVTHGLPLRAAVMLHWDRDRAEQPPFEAVEQVRRCPGPLARLAGRLARVLSRRPATADFARRFFRMVVAACQWDACFDSAERWAGEGLEIFPRDAELLLARGSVREESATLGAGPSRVSQASELNATAGSLSENARKQGFERARRDLEDALAIDAGLVLARVRLGRVLWRLGEAEPARRQLEAALPALREAGHAYLAHLFLGRVQQDSGRLQEAISEYRLAAAIHPGGLAAGMALSHALRLAGDAEESRLALRQGLRDAGHRPQRDPYWDYLVANAADLEALLETLHRESLE